MNSSNIFFLSLALVFIVSNVYCFSPFAKSMQSYRSNQQQQSSNTKLEMAGVSESRPTFGSKLMADITEDELSDIFKEFNITNFDLNKDPELAKWGPSKEFFEKFGFQNNTLKYKRKTMDVKIDFYKSYTKPILPQYKTFIADLMAMTFIQSIDSRYEYDALHAFGLCTQYYTIMKGYALQEEIDTIFNEMLKAVGLDSNRVREDAKTVLALVKDTNLTEDEVLSATDGILGTIFTKVRNNRFFKYSDAWGVGLGRLMELLGVEPKEETFTKWCASLKWVFTTRVMQTWDEFSADQLRLQGVEAMQKQLLIREKKRAAERLEKKAMAFEDKRAALLELNEAIEERGAS